MRKLNHLQELETEREELNRLVNGAIEKGIPMAHINAILEQSRKVDSLVVKTQEEMRREKQQER